MNQLLLNNLLFFSQALPTQSLVFLDPDTRYRLALQNLALRKQFVPHSYFINSKPPTVIQTDKGNTEMKKEITQNPQPVKIEDLNNISGNQYLSMLSEELSKGIQLPSSDQISLKDSEKTKDSSENSECSGQAEELEEDSVPKILRIKPFKHKNLAEGISEDLKSKKVKAKRPESKAHNLWINYGRKIIDFAISHSKDKFQARIRLYFGKLITKRDYLEVFGAKQSDGPEDIAFKVLFGRLAIYFIKNHAGSAFQDSKYRDEMIEQRHIILDLISKLIGLK
jgi:hypothetical protein